FEDPEYAQDAPEGSKLKVKIDMIEAVGTETLVHFNVDAPLALTEDMKELAADVGGEEIVQLEQRAQKGQNEFTAVLDPRSKVRKGEDIELTIDTSRMHFFDPESSRGIYE
ncbi:MAG: hypothetical protein ACRDKZ_12830, partial [Actinomycetota bacterium]